MVEPKKSKLLVAPEIRKPRRSIPVDGANDKKTKKKLVEHFKHNC